MVRLRLMGALGTSSCCSPADYETTLVLRFFLSCECAHADFRVNPVGRDPNISVQYSVYVHSSESYEILVGHFNVYSSRFFCEQQEKTPFFAIGGTYCSGCASM